MALALPAERHTDLLRRQRGVHRDRARASGSEAGVEQKIDLRLAPAPKRSTRCSPTAGAAASTSPSSTPTRTNYDAYYERVLKLLRPGGLIAIDNVLWGGSVADAKDDRSTPGDPRPQQEAESDKRVSISLVPIGDGLTLARKRLRLRERRCPSAGYSTLSPGLMPSRDAVPPGTSSTKRTGLADGIDVSDSGTVRCAILTMVPSLAMNSMSSGISVFFIHMATGVGAAEVEQHAGIGRQRAAEHQPLARVPPAWSATSTLKRWLFVAGLNGRAVRWER